MLPWYGVLWQLSVRAKLVALSTTAQHCNGGGTVIRRATKLAANARLGNATYPSVVRGNTVRFGLQ